MKKVVFIMAASHSGSTLLDLILGSHSRSFSLGELSTAGRNDNRLCGVCGTECTFWSRTSLQQLVERCFPGRPGLWPRLISATARLRCNAYETLFSESGAQVLIDSSKRVHWIRRRLRPLWQWRHMTPYLLYLYRDGRAVVNSLLRKYPERDMASLAGDWLIGTQDRERYYDAFAQDRRCKVDYEQLTKEPEAVVRSLCHWLSVEYEPSMLEYWRHDHHPISGNYGTRWLIRSYRAQQEGREPPKMSERRRTHYERLGLAIRPDTRWREELDQCRLAEFEIIAGEANRRYGGCQLPSDT